MSRQKNTVTHIAETRRQADNRANEAQAVQSDRLLTTKETAEMLGVAPGTLTRARVYGNQAFPAYCKIGKSVRYKLSTVTNWIENRYEFQSTSQEEATA